MTWEVQFPDQGSNQIPCTGSVGSQPLDHQGSPWNFFFFSHLHRSFFISFGKFSNFLWIGLVHFKGVLHTYTWQEELGESLQPGNNFCKRYNRKSVQHGGDEPGLWRGNTGPKTGSATIKLSIFGKLLNPLTLTFSHL